VLALFAAMRRGTPLHVAAGVSARLYRRLPAIQDIYHCWDRGLRKIAVEVASVRAPSPMDREAPGPGSTPGRSPRVRAASTFTGGVDSFYTVLKHRANLDALLYAHGLDVPLENGALRARVSATLQAAAGRLDRTLIEVETNLRHLTDCYLEWPLAFGAALAAVGMLIADRVSLLYVPAGTSYGNLLPDGAHPVLNPLYGTERIDFETDGCEATRFEKVAVIAANDVALDALRVCWENRNDAYNCGECEKCLRTMAALEIVGALGRCRTFDRPLDYERLARAVPPHETMDFFMRENLEAGERLGASPALLAALRRNVRGRRQRVLLDRLGPRAAVRALRRWRDRLVRAMSRPIA
jgi:hypothetical protein